MPDETTRRNKTGGKAFMKDEKLFNFPERWDPRRMEGKGSSNHYAGTHRGLENLGSSLYNQGRARGGR